MAQIVLLLVNDSAVILVCMHGCIVQLFRSGPRANCGNSTPAIRSSLPAVLRRTGEGMGSVLRQRNAGRGTEVVRCSTCSAPVRCAFGPNLQQLAVVSQPRHEGFVSICTGSDVARLSDRPGAGSWLFRRTIWRLEIA